MKQHISLLLSGRRKVEADRAKTAISPRDVIFARENLSYRQLVRLGIVLGKRVDLFQIADVFYHLMQHHRAGFVHRENDEAPLEFR